MPDLESASAIIESVLDDINILSIRLKQPDFNGADLDSLPAATGRVLTYLQQCGPSTVPTIAKARSSSRQNVQVIVNRLLAESFVELLPNPMHKSSDLVCLTRQGRSAAEQAQNAFSKQLDELARPFMEGELESLYGSLQKLKGALRVSAPVKMSARTPVPAKERRPSGSEVRNLQPETQGQEQELPVNLL